MSAGFGFKNIVLTSDEVQEILATAERQGKKHEDNCGDGWKKGGVGDKPWHTFVVGLASELAFEKHIKKYLPSFPSIDREVRDPKDLSVHDFVYKGVSIDVKGVNSDKDDCRALVRKGLNKMSDVYVFCLVSFGELMKGKGVCVDVCGWAGKLTVKGWRVKKGREDWDNYESTVFDLNTKFSEIWEQTNDN